MNWSYRKVLATQPFISDAILALVEETITFSKEKVGPALIKLLIKLLDSKKFRASSALQALKRLEKRGLIKRIESNDEVKLELTEKGKIRLDQIQISDLILPEPPKDWDSQWRIVLFDVPEELKQIRTIFRRKLKQLGFKYLQKSSWIYPHPCEEVLIKLIKRLKIENYVRVVVASQLSSDVSFREYFELKKENFEINKDNSIVIQPRNIISFDNKKLDFKSNIIINEDKSEEVIPLTEL